MKVLVLGSGVIGVTTAYYLNQAGHEVTVVDRQAKPAMETSRANGGQVSWGAGTPWAAPGIPLKALQWLFRRHSPLVLRPRFDPAMWSWLLKMLANCTSARYAVNKERMLRLARYSHECLVELRRMTGISYQESQHGLLELFHTGRELDNAERDMVLLERAGVKCRLLDRDGCLAQEPALQSTNEKISGGLHFPEDESGDCYQFTQGLATRSMTDGVKYVLSTNIERLEADGNRIERVITDRGEMVADTYVLACGSYTPLLLRPLGINLPVYPVKGYSATVTVTDSAAAPVGSITDATYKVVITRLGNRLRAAGTAELAGYDLSLPPARMATIAHVVSELFPGAGNYTDAEYWCGLRPMTPDNPPVIGTTAFQNLYLNTGHGTLGWTMSCGSGRILADLVSQRSPDISLEGLTLARFA
ncbi:MAG: D-amino acid dehydrogenase [Sulfuricaulis sp.]|uniref:D-amino acid dehydrogenase n=1 Tax=Sulfuricaulis sp. TaxID=2003553 RepID=UPI0034A22BED